MPTQLGKPKPCNRCNKTIVMGLKDTGKWGPFEVDGQKEHNCAKNSLNYEIGAVPQEPVNTQAEGFKDAKVNAFINDTMMPAIKKALNEIKDDYMTKTSSTNVMIAEIRKDQTEKVVPLLEALTAKNSFKTAAQQYTEESALPPNGEEEEVVTEDDEGEIEAV